MGKAYNIQYAHVHQNQHYKLAIMKMDLAAPRYIIYVYSQSAGAILPHSLLRESRHGVFIR